jgi:carbonic anhydrase/acetyltransferase-like protein (isoleucine patch superfamily)
MAVHGRLVPYQGTAPTVSDRAFVASTAMVIGDVEIADQASIWYGCVLRGDVNGIRIGPRSNLQDGTIVHASPAKSQVVVEADVLVGHGALLHGCRLERYCSVGARATVLNDCVVETGALVAAGAVLTPGVRVPAGEVWGGVPARRLRRLSESERNEFRSQTAHYVILAEAHDAALAGNAEVGS